MKELRNKSSLYKKNLKEKIPNMENLLENKTSTK